MRTYLIQAGLFILTLITTTLAGAYWIGYSDIDHWWDFFCSGLEYSIPFLTILTAHEMGHYIYAKRYGVEVSLPYYLPFWLPFMETIGTLGAFIKMKSRAKSKTEIFDIGIAGPLAGFVVAIVVLSYGFINLPSPEHIYRIHPEYELYGNNFEQEAYSYKHLRAMDSIRFELFMQKDSVAFRADQKAGELVAKNWERKTFKPQESYMEISLGKNILFWLLGKFWLDDESLLPNQFELFHYPYLFAGYLALFFTALNLLPVGQLDGGHVVYGLFGFRRHRFISIGFFTAFLFLAGVGIFKSNLLGINFFQADPLQMLLFAGAYLYFLFSMYERAFPQNRTTALLFAASIFAGQFLVEFALPAWEGFNGWMVFAYLVGRFFGLEHPPAFIEDPLNWKRKVLGWIALLVFVLCFTPEVFKVQYITP